MKYIVFADRFNYIPVIIPEHATHNTVKVGSCKPDSAGFFSLGKGGVSITEQPSESYRIGPKPERDKQLIEALLVDMGIYAFSTDPDVQLMFASALSQSNENISLSNEGDNRRPSNKKRSKLD